MRLLRTLAYKGLSSRVWIPSRCRVIFVYHDVSDPGSPQYSGAYSTPVSVFREQLEGLGRHFEWAALDRIVSGDTVSSSRPLAAITFDDGFRSVRRHAHPILSSLGIPYAVFANQLAVREDRLFNGAAHGETRGQGSSRVFMDADDLRFLSGEGVIIGSHASSHRQLSSCGASELREEIAGNKRFLEELVGRPVRHFAIPFGKKAHYSREALEACRECGHAYVYSSNPSYFRVGAGFAGGNEPIPRIGVTDQTIEELRFLVNRPLLRRIDL